MAYNDFISAVNTYYENPDTWQDVMSHIVTGSAAEVTEYLKNTPYVDYQLLNDGRIGDYYIVNVLDGFNQSTDIGNVINSNNLPSVANTSVNVGIPSVISKSTTTGSFSGKSGIGLTADTGVTATGVLSTIGVALGAVGLGAQIGKVIGRGLYESNPNAWDSGVLKGLSQVDWDKFAVSIKGQAQEGILGLFGVNGDKTTMYLDENAVAYLTWYYQNSGLLQETHTVESGDLDVSNFTYPLISGNNIGTISSNAPVDNKGNYVRFTWNVDSNAIVIPFITEKGDTGIYACSENPFNLGYVAYSRPDILMPEKTISATQVTHLGRTFYWQGGYTTNNYTHVSDSNVNFEKGLPTNLEKRLNVVYLMLYGSTISGINGITNNANSTQFDPTGVGSVATALGALKNQYPELWDKSIKKSVPQEDGTEDEHVYVPIPIPKFNGAFDTQPTTGTPSQSDPSISPDTTPDDELNNASNTIAPPSTPTDDPNTGGGKSPSIVVPSQQASALWAIYNPSLAQLNQLGAWLWSTNFIDQILKIFNDPMQAIIGLHKVYATPNISGSGNIKVGYLDSGVPSNIVGNQYTYIDCGTISLREYYGNILDYSPYTTVQLYLPFIGIVPLDVADVTRASISVKYGVDVLTGACLASVSVQRDNAGGVLYQYSGNCACQYPLSSGSYMGMVTGAIGAVGSLAKGNIFGTALSIAGMHTSIEHSGGFSGNAGAMGGKKPYLIVSRPQTAMNDGFPAIQGYPSNVFVTLGSCTGYVQIADCHVENISATDKELEKIKQLLKEGVIL